MSDVNVFAEIENLSAKVLSEFNTIQTQRTELDAKLSTLAATYARLTGKHLEGFAPATEQPKRQRMTKEMLTKLAPDVLTLIEESGEQGVGSSTIKSRFPMISWVSSFIRDYVPTATKVGENRNTRYKIVPAKPETKSKKK